MTEFNSTNKKTNQIFNISVIIASFNRAYKLEQTILSILNQTIPVYEIIVCDDGSTDNTKKIVEKFGKKIKYIYCKNSGRPSIPRNHGIQVSKGDYIAFCDDDDLWLPHKIESQINILKKNNCKIVCSNAFHLYEGVKTKKKYFKDLFFFLSFNNIFNDNKVILSTSLVSKDLLLSNNFNESPLFKAVEDYDLWLKLSKNNLIYYLNEPLIYYESKSLLKISSEKKIYNNLKVLLVKIKYFNFHKLLILKTVSKIFKKKNSFHNHSDLISVIMPVYNNDLYLEDSIKSILNQSHQNLELLIVDDGSTDRSLEIIKLFQKQDPRIKIYRNKKNMGISYSLNKLIIKARGKFIARMDADDISYNHRLSLQLDFMKKNKTIDILSTGIKYFGYLNYKLSISKEHDHIKFLLPLVNIINHPTVFIKTDKLLKKKFRYNSKYDGLEDWILWNELKDFYKFQIIDEITLKYRTYNPKIKYKPSMSKSLYGNDVMEEFNEMIKKDFNKIFYIYRSFFVFKNFFKNYKYLKIIDFYFILKIFKNRFFMNKKNIY